MAEIIAIAALILSFFLLRGVRQNMNDDAATRRRDLALRLALPIPESATVRVVKGKYADIVGGKPTDDDVPLVWDGTDRPYPRRWTVEQREADERFWQSSWVDDLSVSEWDALSRNRVPGHIDRALFGKVKSLEDYKRTKASLVRLAKAR